MLFGEHAVVYGYPCIVTAVDLRYFVSTEKLPTDEVIISTSQSGGSYKFTIPEIREIKKFQPEISFVAAVVKHFYTKFDITAGVQVSTDGPEISYGLGSSSAVTVAAIAALANLFTIDLDKKGIFDLAYSTVLDVQGKASGFDVAAAVFGGTIYYQNGGKIIKHLGIEELPIVIGFTGNKVSTTKFIELVTKLRDKHTVLVDNMFKLIGEITTQAETELLARNWENLGDLLNLNQGLLDSLGVNTVQLNNLIFAARASGAFGAKLSGAGGGDCMFCIAHPDNRQRVENAIEQAGGTIVQISSNIEGVKIEI